MATCIPPITEKKPYYGITGWASLVDAATRAAGRWAEMHYMMDPTDPPIEGVPALAVRLPFRYASEAVRYGLSRMVENSRVENVKEKKSNKDIWITGLQKPIEITAASGLIEPNLFHERFARVGAGAVNAGARFFARGGLMALKVIPPENLNPDIIPDEALVRTAARFIWSDTENQPLKFSLLTLEQLFINQWLAKMPLKEHVIPWLKKQIKVIKPTS